jgi:tRNA A58 N-methylase Trm61
MNAVIERVQHLGIEGSSACIVMTNIEVVEAISQVVDVSQMTDAELWEAIVLVNREVMRCPVNNGHSHLKQQPVEC